MNSEIMLSICIGTYNRKEYLFNSLLSILKCSREDYEIVVVDNASEDGTWEALQGINDNRVKVFRNDVNKGAAFNMIRALMLARGRYRMSLNDRDSIDIIKLTSFLDFLNGSQKIGDVIVAMNEIKDVSKEWERAYLYMKDSHPGNYIYSEVVINNISHALDMDYFEGKKKFDEKEYNISRIFYIVLFQFKNWYSYPEQLTIVMKPEIRNNIKQQRVDVLHGEPWFAPEVRVKWIEEQTIMCKQIGNYDLWKGFYRASLRIILGVCYNQYNYKELYWWKMPIWFAKETKKILMQNEIWDKCKYKLRYETINGYYFLLRVSPYRFYKKYIMRNKK